LIRVAVSFGAVFLVLHFANHSDFLSDLTRPVVAGLLQAFGLAATQGDESLLIGRLAIPWSRDCAGLNVLAILWAMTIWTNRFEPQLSRFALRLLAAIPAAFAANLARILTLIAYRHVLFPTVESPQLHYFIGFLWLVPVVWFFCPRRERTVSRYAAETLQLAAGLSLLAPLISAPGGNLVALCTLLLLANSQFGVISPPRRTVTITVWLAAGLCIGASGMESLWLPWLIACPAFTSSRAVLSLPGLSLLLGTIPLVAMHSIAQWAMLAAAGFLLWQWKKVPAPASAAPAAVPLPTGVYRFAWPAAVTMALMIPFAAAPVYGLFAERGSPPAAARPLALGTDAYRVRLLGQPPDLDLVWYEPTGEGRHHTLDVCMRYRGVTLQPASVDQVRTDGQHWMREFFLLRSGLLLRYEDYLRRTFLPFTPAGVHVIASSPTNAMTAEGFAVFSEQSVRELYRMHQQAHAAHLRAEHPLIAVTP
jgi:exosortase/archaeosortase family protein